MRDSEPFQLRPEVGGAELLRFAHESFRGLNGGGWHFMIEDLHLHILFQSKRRFIWAEVNTLICNPVFGMVEKRSVYLASLVQSRIEWKDLFK